MERGMKKWTDQQIHHNNLLSSWFQDVDFWETSHFLVGFVDIYPRTDNWTYLESYPHFRWHFALMILWKYLLRSTLASASGHPRPRLSMQSFHKLQYFLISLKPSTTKQRLNVTECSQRSSHSSQNNKILRPMKLPPWLNTNHDESNDLCKWSKFVEWWVISRYVRKPKVVS